MWSKTDEMCLGWAAAITGNQYPMRVLMNLLKVIILIMCFHLV